MNIETWNRVHTNLKLYLLNPETDKTDEIILPALITALENEDTVAKKMLAETRVEVVAVPEAAVANAPEWETPAHLEVDLSTADPETLGLDLLDDDDLKLIDAIEMAKHDKRWPLTFFEGIATPLIRRGWKVAPCYPKDKTVHTRLVPDPLNMISNDPAKINEWGLAEPDANVCVYAEQIEGGLLFLDKDGAVSLREKYERETGNKFPLSLLVRSSVVDDGKGGTIAKGHWYFKQTPRTLTLTGNISEKKTGGLFSLRVHNQYVASIGSIHQKTGKAYEIAEDFPVLPIPDDLLDWLLKQVVDDKPMIALTGEKVLVPRGQIHGAYIAEAGRLWQRGYSEADVVEMTIKWTNLNCEGPIDDQKVRKEVFDIVTRYKPTPSGDLVLSQTPQDVKASEWPAITPLEDLLSPVLPFKKEFLPTSIQPWVTDVSERMSVPLDFAGICALVTLAGVVGRRVFVYPKEFDKEWKESICLSGAVAAHSGKIKTPTWKIFTNVVVEQEMDWKKESNKKNSQYAEDLKAWKTSKKLKEKNTDGGAMETPEPQKPSPCRCVVLNDATPEAMHAMMEENPEGLLYYRDELSGWVAELDKDGREGQRDIFLTAMNGNHPHSVHRIGRGHVHAIMCTSVFGGFQPDILVDFLSGSRNIASGMVPRFPLLVWPDENELPLIDRPANDGAKQQFRSVVRALMSMEVESIFMHFNPEAQPIFNKWFAEHERKTNKEENTGKQSHLAKYKGALPKIAALLQLVDMVALGGNFTGAHYIDREHIQKAIAFLDYLEGHMHRVYDSRREGLQQVESLLARVIKKGRLKDGLSAREISLKHWHGLTDADHVEGALMNLAEKGWVRQLPVPSGAGRPTIRWEINPAVKRTRS